MARIMLPEHGKDHKPSTVNGLNFFNHEGRLLGRTQFHGLIVLDRGVKESGNELSFLPAEMRPYFEPANLLSKKRVLRSGEPTLLWRDIAMMQIGAIFAWIFVAIIRAI